MRWLHCLDHADNIQKPADSQDCLLDVVPQPTDSRLSETNRIYERIEVEQLVTDCNIVCLQLTWLAEQQKGELK